MNLHGEDKEGYLSIDETKIIKGALDLRDKSAQNAMSKLDSIFMLESTTKLNKEILSKVSTSSSIPIHSS